MSLMQASAKTNGNSIVMYKRSVNPTAALGAGVVEVMLIDGVVNEVLEFPRKAESGRERKWMYRLCFL